MITFFAGCAIFLLLNLLMGLVRIYRGPTMADRLLAAQLMGTTGTAILIILAAKQSMPSLVDAALVIALLSAVTLMAFVGRLWRRPDNDPAVEEEPHGNP